MNSEKDPPDSTLIHPLQRLVIVCGGTGGHFYPGLSIAKEFSDAGGKVELFISGKNSSAQSALASASGIDSRILPQSRNPAGIASKALFFCDLLRDARISLKELKRFRPSAVLAMGSFNCVAPSIAAKLLGIPLFLHDGNARVGKANRLLSRFAEKLFLSFPPANPETIKCMTSLVGMPLRKELISSGILPRKDAIEALNSKFSAKFSEDATTVFVFGGSQGALSLNSVLPKALLQSSAKRKIQVMHLCGFNNSEMVQKNYAPANFPLLILDSSPEMHLFYSTADLAVCRSGGSTIAELAFFAKSAILIPYPHAAENHQYDNACHYASSSAAAILMDQELKTGQIQKILDELLDNPAALSAKGIQGSRLAMPEASKALLYEISNTLKTKYLRTEKAR